jgi:hypothetical protein
MGAATSSLDCGAMAQNEAASPVFADEMKNDVGDHNGDDYV